MTPSFVRIKPSKNNLQIKNFDLEVPGCKLLIDTQLQINQKQKYGLIGKNGLGKSVLLKSICTQLEEHQESVLLVSQNILTGKQTPMQSVLSSDKEREWLMDKCRVALCELA